MGILSNKHENYLKFFRFILKYWDSEIFLQTSVDTGDLDEIYTNEWEHSPEELVEDLKSMGPTYVKLGQLLSTRPDMLPEKYLDALSGLQDDVDTIPYKEVEIIFREEIGARISKAFASFEEKPLASASIGQVHRATLHCGTKVAVKIQRPGIRKQFIEDLDTLMALAEKAESLSKKIRRFSLIDTLEGLQYILMQELDYRKEAKNPALLKQNMREFKSLLIPAPIPDFCSRRVLTMEFVDGQKPTTLSPFQLESINREELISEFVKGYLKQIIIDGFAHADPHPGNIHITKDGKMALMDLGMVARFDTEIREQILKLMIGLSSNEGNQVTQVLLNISEYDKERADLKMFKRQIIRQMQENENKQAADLQTGRSLLKINKIAAQLNVKLPVELISLGKILLNMDQIIAVLAPEFQLQKIVEKYLKNILQEKMMQEMKSTNLLRNLLESKEFIGELPYRMNRITEDLANHEFKIKMDVIDERRFILAFQKVANRITTGLIVAALILGAAIVMHIPTRWSLLGYPAFAVLLFTFAALIGFYLVYQILFKDEEDKHGF